MSRLHLKQTHEKLPTHEYELIDGEKVVGKIQIRMKPSRGKDVPPDFANHIYYEIEEQYRNKGYGKKILKLGLEEAKRLGLKEVIITCDELNTASKKIIEANGGVFLDKKPLLDRSGTILKYKIFLR